MRTTWTIAATLFVACLGSAPLAAQRGYMRGPGPEPSVSNVPYDGRFVFARLKYTTGPGGYYYQGMPAWAHGYQKAENNLVQIVAELSKARMRLGVSNVLALDDPNLLKFPVAYMTEAGYWTMNDNEAAGLRAYLKKGGFVIFDDFRDDFRNDGGWNNFAANMKRVLPDIRFFDLESSNPIFHSFFEIPTLESIPQSYGRGRPIFRAVYEDNDPKKRMLAVINFNTDISDFWEFSGSGFYPISESNEGYKLGVNYLIYALSH